MQTKVFSPRMGHKIISTRQSSFFRIGFQSNLHNLAFCFSTILGVLFCKYLRYSFAKKQPAEELPEYFCIILDGLMHYCLQLNKFNGKYSARQIRSIAFVWGSRAGNVRETRHDRFPFFARSFVHLFPLKACNFCIYRSKSRNYQFFQIDIVSAPDQLDQDVCKLTRFLSICPSCSPTKRSSTRPRSGSDDGM